MLNPFGFLTIPTPTPPLPEVNPAGLVNTFYPLPNPTPAVMDPVPGQINSLTDLFDNAILGRLSASQMAALRAQQVAMDKLAKAPVAVQQADAASLATYAANSAPGIFSFSLQSPQTVPSFTSTNPWGLVLALGLLAVVAFSVL